MRCQDKYQKFADKTENNGLQCFGFIKLWDFSGGGGRDKMKAGYTIDTYIHYVCVCIRQ